VPGQLVDNLVPGQLVEIKAVNWPKLAIHIRSTGRRARSAIRVNWPRYLNRPGQLVETDLQWDNWSKLMCTGPGQLAEIIVSSQLAGQIH
jgi:hypothetical protein